MNSVAEARPPQQAQAVHFESAMAEQIIQVRTNTIVSDQLAFLPTSAIDSQQKT